MFIIWLSWIHFSKFCQVYQYFQITWLIILKNKCKIYNGHIYQRGTSDPNIIEILFYSPKNVTFKTVICQHTIIEQYWMYSTLSTLNNKKITAMFYVHLFLKAMYMEKQSEENELFKLPQQKAWQSKFWSCRKPLHHTQNRLSIRSEEETSAEIDHSDCDRD